MANMLRANQAIRAINKSVDLSVYGECTYCLLTSVNAIDRCLTFVPGGSIGSIESVHCQFCRCHQNVHRRLNINNHQPPPASTQQQTITQSDVKMEESSNTQNANYLDRISKQMYNSSGVSIELTESVMARATEGWKHSNKVTDENKRKKSWDEHVEYEMHQSQILANQSEWTLNLRSENEKNKRIKKNEEEKSDDFEMI